MIEIEIRNWNLVERLLGFRGRVIRAVLYDIYHNLYCNVWFLSQRERERERERNWLV